MKFLTVKELSDIMNVKPSTIYAWVEGGIIPHYKFNHLVRFEETETEQWWESRNKQPVDVEKMAKNLLRPSKTVVDVDQIAKKLIAEETKKSYTANNGKPGLTRGTRKEVQHGTC